MQVKVIDRFGGVASAICVAHCLIVTLGFSMVSTLDLDHSFQEIFEWSFFSLAIVFALVSASIGFKVIKKVSLFAFFGAGIVLLSVGRLSEAFEWFEGGDFLSIAGGFTLFLAHLWSMRCC